MDAFLHDHGPAISRAMGGVRLASLPEISRYAGRVDPVLRNEFNRLVDDKTQLRANCYAYAANDMRNPVGLGAQPGIAGGAGHDDDEERFHAHIHELTALDGFRAIERFDDVDANEYAVALFTTPDQERRGFHYYRQDEGGSWSHKLAFEPASNLDASQRPIRDPLQSDRRFSTRNYADFRGFFAAPNSGLTVGVPARDRAFIEEQMQQPSFMPEMLDEEYQWAPNFGLFDLKI